MSHLLPQFLVISSLRAHPVFPYVLVISVITTTHCPSFCFWLFWSLRPRLVFLLVLGDFDHCDRVLSSFSVLDDFVHYDRIPSAFSNLGDFSHYNRVLSHSLVLGDFDH